MRILKVIESKRWRNVKTGATTSLYGAVPYHNELGKAEWTIETVGYTWRLADGTVGLGRVPCKTREEAQEVMDRLNARICACHSGSTCDVSHAPALCECSQCTTAEAKKPAQIWCATYCNKAHRVSDGKPIRHECRIIPPRAIQAESGDTATASQIMSEAPIRMMRRGVRK